MLDFFKGNKNEDTSVSSTIDLNQIKLKDTSIMEVINPITGEKSGATIEIYNKFSDEYDLAQFEAMKNLTYKEKKITIAVGITKEIKGFFEYGKELTSSKEDIKKLYESCPMFLNDIDTFFSNTSNFFLNK